MRGKCRDVANRFFLAVRGLLPPPDRLDCLL
jgi:hypothetical protein